MSSRLLRHLLVAFVVLGTCTSTGWAVSSILPADDEGQLAAVHAPTQAIVDEIERARYAELAGYHFVAAAASEVTPAQRNADLIAAVDAVVPLVTTPRSVWDALADCESGDWHNGTPLPGTARWDYGLTFSHGDIFEGGVNFHPRTWDSYKDAGMPNHAGQATREQQIAIAERVLRDQGWRAWPVCSRKLGLR